MRNKIDFTLPPDQLFFDPWRDQGLQVLRAPDPLWRAIPTATVRGFPVSIDLALNQRMRRTIRDKEVARDGPSAIVYDSQLALLENATFQKSFLKIGDRLLLSGAMGPRTTNQFRTDYRKAGMDGGPLLDAFFTDAKTENAGRKIPVSETGLPEGVDFAVACRNTFNYFHFITEALCQLTVLDDVAFKGNIYFHYPNPDDRRRQFVRAFAESLFPEYVGRMFFERAPKTYDRVLTAYDFSGGHYQSPPEDTAGMAGRLSTSLSDDRAFDHMENHVDLSANMLNLSMVRLRERALRAVAGRDTSHLPKRFFFGRDTRHSRMRHMRGEETLVEHLALFDFEYVVFENMAPLDQIALAANAEIMVSYHGAGFTNMLFAQRGAIAIEIGTVETLKTRWGDFAPLAHLSGCDYFTFFADLSETDRQDAETRDTGGLIPGHLSRAASADILSFIVTLCGHAPRMPGPRPLTALVERLLAVGKSEQAMEALESHQTIVEKDNGLLVLKADCHKALGEPKSELLALDAAFRVDPSHWHILVRIIWCAKRCERPQVIRWALSRLETDFPDRHAIFVENHHWVRYVA